MPTCWVNDCLAPMGSWVYKPCPRVRLSRREDQVLPFKIKNILCQLYFTFSFLYYFTPLSQRFCIQSSQQFCKVCVMSEFSLNFSTFISYWLHCTVFFSFLWTDTKFCTWLKIQNEFKSLQWKVFLQAPSVNREFSSSQASNVFSFYLVNHRYSLYIYLCNILFLCSHRCVIPHTLRFSYLPIVLKDYSM